MILAAFQARLTVLIHSLFSKILAYYSSFDFLDEHHIVYGSSEDTIHVYDFRETRQATQEQVGHLRFQLDLPPIYRCRTIRRIQIQRNALPFRTQEPHEVSDLSLPPFHADPHARLVVFRIVTESLGLERTESYLYVPVQALLKHVAATKDVHGGKAVVPWSTWCADTGAASTYELPYVLQARMVACGRRVVPRLPRWDKCGLHIDAYTPRQGVSVLDMHSNEEKMEFLSALCEEALFCYEVQ